MSMAASATVSTANASRYLQQLCKHFGHKTATHHTPTDGWIRFDFGHADLKASAEGLKMTASATSDEDREKLKRVLASHLERFAFREALNIQWDI